MTTKAKEDAPQARRSGVLSSSSEDEDGAGFHKRRRLQKGRTRPTAVKEEEEETAEEGNKGMDSEAERSLRAMMDVDDGTFLILFLFPSLFSVPPTCIALFHSPVLILTAISSLGPTSDQVIRVSRTPAPSAPSLPPSDSDAEDEDVQMASHENTTEQEADPGEDLDLKPKRKRKAKKIVPVGRNGLKKRRVEKTRTGFDEKGYMGMFFFISSHPSSVIFSVACDVLIQLLLSLLKKTVTEDYSSYESVSDEDAEGTKTSAKPKGKGKSTSKDKDNEKDRPKFDESTSSKKASGTKKDRNESSAGVKASESFSKSKTGSSKGHDTSNGAAKSTPSAKGKPRPGASGSGKGGIQNFFAKK